MAEKIYYSMGEVCELLGVNSSLIRFWEEKFPSLHSERNSRGHRIYKPEQVERLKLVYHLVKERGMTLSGAEKVLRADRKQINRDMELTNRLNSIRALLVEIKDDLDSDTRTVADFTTEQPLDHSVDGSVDSVADTVDAVAAKPARKRKKSALEPQSDPSFDVSTLIEHQPQAVPDDTEPLPADTTLDQYLAIQSERESEPEGNIGGEKSDTTDPKPRYVEQTLF